MTKQKYWSRKKLKAIRWGIEDAQLLHSPFPSHFNLKVRRLLRLCVTESYRELYDNAFDRTTRALDKRSENT